MLFHRDQYQSLLFILANVILNVFLAIVVTSNTLFVFLYVVFTSVHIELTHDFYVVFVIVHTFNKFLVILYVVFAFIDILIHFMLLFCCFPNVHIRCSHTNMYY
jgi:hypothetical protein